MARSTAHSDPFSNLSLAAKGVLVVSIPVAALLAAMVVFYQFERQTLRAEDAVQRTFEVRGEISQTLTDMVNAETGVRGFLLTRRQNFLEPYSLARQELPRILGDLRRLTSDAPIQVDRVGHVESLVQGLLDSWERVRQSAGDDRSPAALSQLESDKAAMDRLRDELAAMMNEAQQRLAERVSQARDAALRLRWAVFAGGALGLLGGLFAALLFSTRIVRRVHDLEEDARLVASGHRLEGDVSGNDEIAHLARSFREASILLTDQSEELRQIQAGLERRVVARTAELTAANEELRQSNEVRNALVQSSPLAIWAVDLDGRVTFWNPAAERIFGWSETEVIGGALPVVPPEQQAEYEEWLQRFRVGEVLSGVERQRQRKDGKLIDVAIWTAPLRGEDGSIRGAIAIDNDVSQEKLLEEQFRRSQKLEAVGRLAGGVAHDFNNLLTIITGYTEMILSEAGTQTDIAEYGQEIQYAAERAGALTTQLLAFSRRQTSQPRILDLNESVEHSAKLMRRVIGEDVEILTHLEPALGRVKIDPTHVDQIVMNLAVNARDAMTHGGKLTIETYNQMIDEAYASTHLGVHAGPYCLLAVSDTGTGMNAETRNRLFEPFFTTKEPGKGTGLGLSIVYGIVKQNGGEIVVYSEPGKGTTFKVYLPMVEVPAEFEAERRVVEWRGSEAVLLCEDEGHIRKLVQAMLTKLGYTVLVAATPIEALEIARSRRERIHLLLTDIVMPEMDGFELTKAVLQIAPSIKVLYMSGYTDNRINNGWAMNQDVPFLPKPFTAALLSEKVREALGKTEPAA